MNLTNKLCWLAGFLEADGSIGIFKHKRKEDKYSEFKYSTHVAFINNDPNIINEIDIIVKKLGVNLRLQTRETQKGWATNYTLTAKSYTDCYIILSNLVPYMMGQKRAIALLTMRFLSSRKLGQTRKPYTPIEDKIYKITRKLTKRGVDKKLSSETKRRTLLISDDIVRTHDESMRGEQK